MPKNKRNGNNGFRLIFLLVEPKGRGKFKPKEVPLNSNSEDNAVLAANAHMNKSFVKSPVGTTLIARLYKGDEVVKDFPKLRRE